VSNFVIVTKIGFLPFALSLSKGHSWFDKPVLSEAEGLTTNGIWHNLFLSFVMPIAIGMIDSESFASINGTLGRP